MRRSTALNTAQQAAWNDGLDAGRAAFEAGVPCTPVMDVNIDVLYQRHADSVLQVLEGWHRGWSLANVAAPVYLDDGSVLQLPK